MFCSKDGELRSGWKILRALTFAVVMAAVLAVISAVFRLTALGDYAVHLGMILGVLMELWLEQESLRFVGVRLVDKGFWTDMLIGVGWGAASIAAVAAGMLFVTRELSSGQIGRAFSGAGLGYALVFWLVVAIGEEVMFRGYILSILRPRLPAWLGLAVSAVLFTAIHVINPGYYWFAYVYAFLIAFIFGGIVLKRRGLGCVVGFHYAFNLLQDKGLLNMPARGGELVFAAVLLVDLAVVIWLLPRRDVHTRLSRIPVD